MGVMINAVINLLIWEREISSQSKSDKKIPAYKTCTSVVENTKDELIINNKVYHSINKVLTYFPAKHDRTHKASDRKKLHVWYW